MPYEAETSFLAALADQGAMAVANARLLAAAREKVAMEERQRLARELHDSVSQSLYAIQLGAQMARERLDQDPARAAQPIDYVLRLADTSQAETRALIFERQPHALEMEGLVAALNRQIEAIRTGQAAAACLGPSRLRLWEPAGPTTRSGPRASLSGWRRAADWPRDRRGQRASLSRGPQDLLHLPSSPGCAPRRAASWASSASTCPSNSYSVGTSSDGPSGLGAAASL
jgi:hypothetical protein